MYTVETSKANGDGQWNNTQKEPIPHSIPPRQGLPIILEGAGSCTVTKSRHPSNTWHSFSSPFLSPEPGKSALIDHLSGNASNKRTL